jgi:hypothetical protein
MEMLWATFMTGVVPPNSQFVDVVVENRTTHTRLTRLSIQVYVTELSCGPAVLSESTAVVVCGIIM